jgi:hypothetical protein
MDADGIGGSVELKTKTAGDAHRHNERPPRRPKAYRGEDITISSMSLGKRFGVSHRLGTLIGASYDWNGRNDEKTPPSTRHPRPGTSSARAIDREYKYYRARYGISGAIDYKFNDKRIFTQRHLLGDKRLRL